MKEKVAVISILANALLAGLKILVGLISHSSSILAEGFHSLTDIFSSFIGYFGIRASQKPVDYKHPYGHYKFEVLSGAAITFILLLTGLGVVFEAYKGFLNPGEMKIDYWAFIIMFVSVVVNYLTARIKIYYGKKENSLTLLSDGTHDKVDMLVSGAVLFGLFFSRYYVYTDSLLAILIGLYIIKESFFLGKEAVDSLLDVSAGRDIEEKIKTIVENQGIEISSLKTQKKGSVITANLEIKLPSNLSVKEANKISERLRVSLTKQIDNLVYIAIQIKDRELETSFYKPVIGKGFGWQGKGRFHQTSSKEQGKGPLGKCFCHKCGYETPHKQGIPCTTIKCPDCGLNLERK